MLASWLFAQYLLSNPVQIAYSGTEGYVPVTLTAQNSPEYQDYLSRAGQDNDLYYDVKIKAARLLLEHPEDTFVTPVFNGSASLRNAAGQLIEDVTKSVRRGKTLDDDYMDSLFQDVSSLYHLEESGSPAGQQADLGPLPLGSKVLLAGLAGVWILLLSIWVRNRIPRKKPL